jgi:hypothetical protein
MTTDLDSLPRYDIHPTIREWVGGITVAQFDSSPAVAYKLAVLPVGQEPANPADTPADWYDAQTAYGVKGLWVGSGGAVTPAGGVYLVWDAQLVDAVWSQPRVIGVLNVSGPSVSAAVTTPGTGGGGVLITSGTGPPTDSTPGSIYIQTGV